jgi:hypothetical protein
LAGEEDECEFLFMPLVTGSALRRPAGCGDRNE